MHQFEVHFHPSSSPEKVTADSYEIKDGFVHFFKQATIGNIKLASFKDSSVAKIIMLGRGPND